MNEEIKEITVNPQNEELMVTIPLKEYKKLVKKSERLKAQEEINKLKVMLKAQEEDGMKYYRLYSDSQKNLEDAKKMLAESLGIKELKKVKEEQEG